MKITFFSNFLNHHQLPFCMEMIKKIGDDFTFVATEKIPDERIKLGYEDMNLKYDFVVRSYENESEAYKLANESDVVIIGSAPRKYIINRLKNNIGITFLWSERIFRKKGFGLVLKKLYYKFYKERYQSNNYYLLCSSAYSAEDYNSIGLFKDKAYKWGYFPKVYEYENLDNIIKKKKKNSILWVARFIAMKHPEKVIEIAKRLRNDNYDFNINMIGTGPLYEYIDYLIHENNLNGNVRLLGPMTPQNVRKYMEESEIFLFTSDKEEGWGAVINEAMNSACSVVASHEIGSVPFLINDNVNGLIYEDGNIDDLYNKIKLLLDNRNLRKEIGNNAYLTMNKLWNPKIAASRIIELSHNFLENKECDKYNEGPCSKAERIKDNWKGC